MKVLLDHCVDWRFSRSLPDHEVKTTKEMGWHTLKNGKLLDQAQVQFDVLLTVDKGIEHQQNLAARPIAIILLRASNNSRRALEPLMPQVNALLPTVEPGRVYRVER